MAIYRLNNACPTSKRATCAFPWLPDESWSWFFSRRCQRHDGNPPDG